MTSNGGPSTSASVGTTDPAYTQIFAAMQAQAVASMLGQNTFSATNMLGQNALMAQFSSQNTMSNFAGVNSSQSNLVTAMGMQALQQTAGINFSQLTMGQLMADAIKMSTPVGSMPDDEELLIQALCESETKGHSYRQALEGLHGKNSHAANVWKDYYLEHHRRLNGIISKRCQSCAKPGCAKRPRFDESGPSSSHEKPPLARPSRPLRRRSKEKERAKASRSFDDDDELDVKPPKPSPEPQQSTSERASVDRIPSRCPTPPTELIPIDPQGKAHRYTDADHDFMLNYLRWRLHQEPSITQELLGDELAEKVPHHSAPSWRRYMQRKKDEVEPIFQEARRATPPHEDESSETAADQSDAESASGSQTRDSDNKESDAGDGDSTGEHDEHDEDSDGHDEKDTDSEDDLRHMSGRREAFSDADRRIMARYIASIPDWETLTAKDRWLPYEQMYPQRNFKAYAQLYRTHGAAVDYEAYKYRQRREQQQSVSAQVGRRTGTKGNEEQSSDSRSHKRRHSDSSSGGEKDVPLSARKRGRSDE